MARNNYLVNGVSGTGKTAVGRELRRRGCLVVDADDDLAYFGDPVTLQPTNAESQANWLWDEQRTRSLLADSGPEDLFVCGGAINEDRFWHLFAAVFTLVTDDETLRHRLTSRPDEGLCKQPDYVAAQLLLNRTEPALAKSRGAILIDATRPLADVVDAILDRVGRLRAAH
jgi:hypothetical protein